MTPTMEAEIEQFCQNPTELSLEDYKALEQLMKALSTGEVVLKPCKQFINVMEELVIGEAIACLAEIEATSDRVLDMGDIAAYALNRLPPLYATTEEGANYQRQRAREELQELIVQQVEQAVARYLAQRDFFPERQAIAKGSRRGVLAQVSKLLQSYAPNYEPNFSPES